MARELQITVNDVMGIPSGISTEFFFVISYGTTRYRGKTVQGPTPRFYEQANFKFDHNNKQAKIEIWASGDRFVSGNRVSLDLFMSVLDPTPCSIPLHTSGNQAGGTANLLVNIGEESEPEPKGYPMHSQAASRPQNPIPKEKEPQEGSRDLYGYGGYSSYPRPGYPPQGGYGGYPPQGGYGGYPPQGGYGGYGGYAAPPPPYYAQPQQPNVTIIEERPQRTGMFGGGGGMGLLGAGALGLGAFALGDAIGQDQGFDQGFIDGDIAGGFW